MGGRRIAAIRYSFFIVSIKMLFMLLFSTFMEFGRCFLDRLFMIVLSINFIIFSSRRFRFFISQYLIFNIKKITQRKWNKE